MVSVNMLYGGQRIQNTFHFEKPSAWQVTDLIAIADQALTSWESVLDTIFVNDMSLVSVIARDLSSPTGAAVERFPATTSTGDIAEAGVTNNVALSVKRITALSGRSFRGRVYITGFPTTWRSNTATIATNRRDQIVTAVTNYVGALETVSSSEAVVVSKYSGIDENGCPIARAVGVTTEITGYGADTALDSQRRRLAGRGQ
jgi:hypothetical protein